VDSRTGYQVIALSYNITKPLMPLGPQSNDHKRLKF